MKASDYSSDEEIMENFSFSRKIPRPDLLGSLEKSQDFSYHSFVSYEEDQAYSFDSSVHDIYEFKPEIQDDQQ